MNIYNLNTIYNLFSNHPNIVKRNEGIIFYPIALIPFFVYVLKSMLTIEIVKGVLFLHLLFIVLGVLLVFVYYKRFRNSSIEKKDEVQRMYNVYQGTLLNAIWPFMMFTFTIDKIDIPHNTKMIIYLLMVVLAYLMNFPPKIIKDAFLNFRIRTKIILPNDDRALTNIQIGISMFFILSIFLVMFFLV